MEPQLRAFAGRTKPVTASRGLLMKALGRGRSAIAWVLLVPVLLACSCSKDSELARVTAAARRGNAEAQFQLGEYYYEGPNLAPDYEAAAAWFGRAARQGHAGAQYALGKMLLNAQGVLPDQAEAANWMSKASQQGYAPAQDELATLYQEGIGVPQDQGEAVKWATKAAEQGLVDAQYHLGSLLSASIPTADKVGACFWLTLAAEDGHQESGELLEALKRQLTPQQSNELTNRISLWRQKHPSPE